MLIVPQSTPEQLAECRALFVEYAESLNFVLCFQSFESELAELPGPYAAPAGRLLLATDDDESAGCIALKRLAADVCEMKRLYVRPNHRGTGLGRRLADTLVREAKGIGYVKMRLDTVATMTEAIGLYRSLGFVEIEPYVYNPIAGALYFELEL